MREIWLNVWGNVCALISGEGVVHGKYGDLINANEERWHHATSCPKHRPKHPHGDHAPQQGRPSALFPDRSAAWELRAAHPREASHPDHHFRI
jgi:hypothetical protein